jgi:hypothetical protein
MFGLPEFLTLLALIVAVSSCLLYRLTKVPPWILLAASYYYLVIIRVLQHIPMHYLPLSDNQFFLWLSVGGGGYGWIIVPLHVGQTASIVWLYLALRKWYRHGGSRSVPFAMRNLDEVEYRGPEDAPDEEA